jgi:hypothetical protein
MISRGTAVVAIATFATCATACSSSSPQQAVVHFPPDLPGDDTTVFPPIDPPFYVVPPSAVASTVDAATSDSGDASTMDTETGVDARASDAALDGDTGADAPAGDATALELDSAADAPVDADR